MQGEKYYKYTIGKESKERAKDGSILVECHCDCGNTNLYTKTQVRNALNGKNKNKIARSCGCFKVRQDLTGKRFNMFTIIGISDKKDYDGGVMWECRCDCGNIKHYRTNRAKKVVSCGCINNNNISDRFEVEYNTWKNIRQRCYNTKHPKFENYGGRGITVCERWNIDFFNFLYDMGERPKDKNSIGRIDNDKGYSKENCRWENHEEQSLNKSMLKNNTSGVKGVRLKRGNRWTASLEYKGKVYYLGNYKDKNEAIQARKEAELKHYGKLVQDF